MFLFPNKFYALDDLIPVYDLQVIMPFFQMVNIQVDLIAFNTLQLTFISIFLHKRHEDLCLGGSLKRGGSFLWE